MLTPRDAAPNDPAAFADRIDAATRQPDAQPDAMVDKGPGHRGIRKDKRAIAEIRAAHDRSAATGRAGCARWPR